MTDVNFKCTGCGNCCHDLKLPLTVAEAVRWLCDGHRVQVLCEAVPWPAARVPLDTRQLHRSRRSFQALSGSFPIRVTVILAASFEGACPNLDRDNACSIYARRPLVCRIYPAEISPFIELQPAMKGCPPEAWTPRQPLMLRHGVIVDPELAADISASRDADARDVPLKRQLCSLLGMNCAALAGEGLVLCEPEQKDLHRLLQRLRLQTETDVAPPPWRLLSNRASSVVELAGRGAIIDLAETESCQPYRYIGLSGPGPDVAQSF